jgi:hypothetical protein
VLHQAGQVAEPHVDDLDAPVADELQDVVRGSFFHALSFPYRSTAVERDPRFGRCRSVAIVPNGRNRPERYMRLRTAAALLTPV